MKQILIGTNKSVIDSFYYYNMCDIIVVDFDRIYGKNAGYIQVYNGDITSQFYYEDYWYNPVYVVLKDKRIILHWVKWKKPKTEYNKLFNKYSEEEFEYYILDEAPGEITKLLEGKDIYFDCQRYTPITCNVRYEKDEAEPVNQFFVDEMSKQVSLLIERELGVENIAKTGISLSMDAAPKKHILNKAHKNNWNYKGYTYKELSYYHKNIYYARNGLWVKWRSLNPEVDYLNLGKYVTSKDVEFELCIDIEVELKKEIFKEYMNPVANCYNPKVYEFLVYEKDWNEWKQMLLDEVINKKKEKIEKQYIAGIEFEIKCTWPDVIMEIYFKNKLSGRREEQTTEAICGFFEKWNNEQTENKGDDFVHDFGPFDDGLGRQAVLCFQVDFGNSPPELLMEITKYLSEKELGIKKIVFY